MTNGNDIVEHIEKCEHCQKVQEKINKLTGDINMLGNEIVKCFVNKGIRE